MSVCNTTSTNSNEAIFTGNLVTSGMSILGVDYGWNNIDRSRTFTISNIKHPTIMYEETKKENVYMETLYSVVIVDNKREILIDTKVVAKSRDGAKKKAGVYNLFVEKDINPDDITEFISEIGKVKVEVEEKK